MSTGLETLLLYLGIAAVLVFIGGFKGMGWFRRGLDRQANRSNPNQGLAKIIASAGDDKEVQSFAGRSTFRLSIGIRLLSTVLSGALLVTLFNEIGSAEPILVPAEYAVHAFFGGLFVALLYLLFIWKYHLMIEGYELHVPRYVGGHKVYDLRKIEHVEHDGGYMLRMWFSEGGKAEVIQYIEGRGKFMKTINEFLAQGEFGVGAVRT